MLTATHQNASQALSPRPVAVHWSGPAAILASGLETHFVFAFLPFLAGRTGLEWPSVRSAAKGTVGMIGAMPSCLASAYSNRRCSEAIWWIFGEFRRRASARWIRFAVPRDAVLRSLARKAQRSSRRSSCVSLCSARTHSSAGLDAAKALNGGDSNYHAQGGDQDGDGRQQDTRPFCKGHPYGDDGQVDTLPDHNGNCAS